MEPLSPKMRQALKDTHPGLTDDIINRYELLTRERFNHAPSDYEDIERIDRERTELLRRYMPRYRQVSDLIRAEDEALRARMKLSKKRKVTVIFKRQ